MRNITDVNLKSHFRKLLLLFSVFIAACAGQQEEPVLVQIIPQPNEVVHGKGFFRPAKTITIGISNTILEPIARYFTTTMASTWDIQITKDTHPDIKLELQPAGFQEHEAYKLEISRKGVTLSAGTPKGIFNGLQSLRQMLMAAAHDPKEKKIASVTIMDHPRFGWRGLMLDESRHFFGVEQVKELLDQMALHKLNVFHWHLTDAPGWRIEIKGYPLLTEVGGAGDQTDPDAPAQFYTQEEIREIVRYAADRFIEIVPEIDMPGHATAANRAYPAFSGGGSERHPDFTFDPGNEGTYAYLTAILREVADLFPSKYIHLGGDEVHFGNQQWNSNPGIKFLMKQEGFETLLEVESYFVNRMADSIAMLGKTVIGWDEIVDHGLDKDNSLVMWWRHDLPDKLEAALQQGYPVVLCPRIPLYFDFVQHKSHKAGRRWRGGAYSSLDLVYAFPPDTLPEFNNRYDQIRGIQANLWTEVIKTTRRLHFMTYPRMSALAEAAWTIPENKDFEQFMLRLPAMIDHLRDQDIAPFDPFSPESVPEPKL